MKIISNKETYAYEISRELARFGFGTISEGTIYPIILRLQKNDLVISEQRISRNGSKRKYFFLTEKGRASLDDFIRSWNEMDNAINNLIKGLK